MTLYECLPSTVTVYATSRQKISPLETWQGPGRVFQLPADPSRRFDLRRFYHVFTERSPSAASRGVALLIIKTIAVVRQIPSPQAVIAQGRIAAVDLKLADIMGRPKLLRVIGVYAPVASSRDRHTDIDGFWNEVKALTTADHPFIIGGDFNTFLHVWESSKGPEKYNEIVARLYRAAYRRFLANTAAIDTWEQQQRVVVGHQWTARGWQQNGSLKILDRFAIARDTTCRGMETLSDADIPHTNHRPVLAQISIGALAPTAHKMVNLAPPRLRRPKNDKAKERYAQLREHIAADLDEQPPLPDSDGCVLTDSDYDELLSYCTEKLTTASRAVFKQKRGSRLNDRVQITVGSESHALALRMKMLGRIIRAMDEDRLDAFLAHRPQARDAWTLVCIRAGPFPTIQDARAVKRGVSREFHKVVRGTLSKIASDAAREDFKRVLSGGPLRQLFDPTAITNPPLLQAIAPDGSSLLDANARRKGYRLTHHDRPESSSGPRPLPEWNVFDLDATPGPDPPAAVLASTSKARLDVWTDYLEVLLHRDEKPDGDKPWLRSEACARYREANRGANGFEWPRVMNLDDLYEVLRKGNSKPSPGPDGWEKWALKQSGSDFLTLVLRLCNYTIVNNYFPPPLKENYISPLYKRGDVTDPRNYRGIVFANCLHNLIASWCTRKLQEFVWRRSLLPPTQIASQRGVRSSDLTHFLNEVDHAAKLNGDTIWVCKRDHEKGFDNLYRTAAPDAYHFFGLDQLIAFEQARTLQVSFRVKSQDGIGERAFYTDGTTKQGDNLSCAKYTLAMAMQEHWIAEELGKAGDTPVKVETVNSRRRVLHVRADRPKGGVQLRSTEVLDDSLRFAHTIPALNRSIELSERFQDEYEIRTHWGSKTEAYVIGKIPDNLPETITLTIAGMSHQVQVSRRPSILRTAYLDRQYTLQNILALIDGFPLATNRDYPVSVLCKVAWGLLVPRILPRLHLHPLRPADAHKVDEAVTRKITAAMKIPYTRTSILSLPLSYKGFDFPSFYVLNGQIAVGNLLRGLNHHLEPMRVMAEITLANWQCQGNACVPPLERPAETLITGQGGPAIPYPWLAAAEYLKLSRICITSTDQSDLPKESMQHVARRAAPTLPERSRHILQYFDRIQPSVAFSEYRDAFLNKTAFGAMRTQNPAILNWLRHFDLRELMFNDKSPLRTRAQRKQMMARALKASFTPDRGATARIWSSDGSAKAYPAGPSTTAAVCGPAEASYLIIGQPTSSRHGELLGLIAAATGTTASNHPANRIITDYANGVTAVKTLRSAEFDPFDWRGSPTREYMMWLVDAFRSTTAPVEHVKAHTDAHDVESELNKKTDLAARSAHLSTRVTIITPPTAYMANYVPYDTSQGYLPDDWKATMASRLHEDTFRRHTPKFQLRLGCGPNPATPTPPYLYRSSPAHAATRMQLLVRTGRLLTFDVNEKVRDRSCKLCGHHTQTEYHIFSHCPHFDEIRQTFVDDAVSRHVKYLASTSRGASERTTELVREYLKSVVYGERGSPWRFWYGVVPPPPAGLTTLEAKVAHELAIRLTTAIAKVHFRDVMPIYARNGLTAPGIINDSSDDAGHRVSARESRRDNVSTAAALRRVRDANQGEGLGPRSKQKRPRDPGDPDPDPPARERPSDFRAGDLGVKRRRIGSGSRNG